MKNSHGYTASRNIPPVPPTTLLHMRAFSPCTARHSATSLFLASVSVSISPDNTLSRSSAIDNSASASLCIAFVLSASSVAFAALIAAFAANVSL